MPFRGDLGLPGAVLLLVLGPVIALLVRRRWRLAAARREEVMRLALRAAEDAARAEVETNLAYVSHSQSALVPGGGNGAAAPPPQCAVCYCPTTTRCSRCKLVRYCSGKCQIIHWRQGHKEECCPPQGDDHCNNQENISDLKGVQAQQSDWSNSNLEIEGNPHAEPFKTFSKRSASLKSNCSSEDIKKSSMGDTTGTESTSDSTTVLSSSSSSCCSTFSGHVETSDDASSSEDSLLHNARKKECLTSDTSSSPRTVACEMKPKKFQTSVFGTTSVSVSSASCLSNFTQKVPPSKTEDVGCVSIGPFGVCFSSSIESTTAKASENADECQDGSPHIRVVQNGGDAASSDIQTCQEGDHTHPDVGSLLQMSPKLSGQDLSSHTNSRTEHFSNGASKLEDTVQLKTRDSIPLDVDRSGCVANGRSNDIWLLKSKGFRSSSSASSDDRRSSDRGNPAASHASSKFGNAPTNHSRPLEVTDSVQNGSNDLNTPVRRVVQQIKSSTFSRHQPSRLGSYISGKYNSKMLFPYELFLKLYNCDKVELSPCGLTNCGNSCYANAVLQCLAFTRPLTAYLLEGLHTKTCPKKKWCFTCEFESLLGKVKQGKSPLSPIGIISHIHDIGSNLGRGREEDAHEFLRYAIDAMQSVCIKEAGRGAVGHLTEETTLIQLIFGGYLRSTIKCMRCQGKSEHRERMMDLTVEINGDISTLEEALARFTATEILDGDNKYQCNRCKSYERAKKKLTILEAPNVLTIALKRFQSGKFGKLNKTVRFPEYLNLAPYMRGNDDKSPVYRLYAVVVHLDVMNAAFSGHYVCYVKDTQGKWYKVDDNVVKSVELERVLKQGAYLLFYARCSPRAPSLLRKGMTYDHGNINIGSNGAVPSGRNGEDHISKARSSSMLLCPGLSVAQNWTINGHANFEPLDLFGERFRAPKTDSSSDSSSLLSCSDEGSCSTESTRDSTRSEEYSEYIFGESGRSSWNYPLRFSEDSNGFTNSLVSLKRSEAISNGHDRYH